MSLLPNEEFALDIVDDIVEDPYGNPITFNDPHLYRKLMEGQSGNGEREIPREKYLVVMPSIRPIAWQFLEPLQDFDIFICDDSKGKVERPHYNKWGEVGHSVLGEDLATKNLLFKRVFFANRDFTTSYVGADNLELFPDGNPSVKNIGLYYAVKEGYEAVILLDDDCDASMRSPRDFMTIGRKLPTWEWTTVGGWMNTLALISSPDQKMFARGFPYEYRTYGNILRFKAGMATPYFNEGLWYGEPDINGMDKLEMWPEVVQDYSNMRQIDLPWYVNQGREVLPGQVSLNKDQKLPLSIMNCQIHTSLIPAFFQPADHSIYRSFRVRRHDDIWSMYFLRKIMGHLNLDITVGDPMVLHTHQTNCIGEILSEHYTNLIQRPLTEILDDVAETGYVHYYGDEENTISASVVGHMANELATRAIAFGEWELRVPGCYKAVLQSYLGQVSSWAKLFV